MKEKLQEEVKQALREKNEVKTGALRMLLAAFVNKEKEKGEQLGEEEMQSIVMSEVKKRREALEAFEKGGRPEMAEKEKAEMEILQQYLPEQLSEEEVAALVTKALADTGASTPQDMGKVMAALMPQIKGKADGQLVSRLVKEALS